MSALQSEIIGAAAWPTDATQRMNRMYRWQRHIYDATRRHYLLGRDQMIAGLKPAPGARVLEIGCGTGRNLIKAAQTYPEARFFGLDVSTEMLTSAIERDRARGLGRPGQGRAWRCHRLRSEAAVRRPRVRPHHDLLLPVDDPGLAARAGGGDAQARSRAAACTSSISAASSGCRDSAAALLRRWLALFDVTPRDDLERDAAASGRIARRRLQIQRPFRDYAQYAVLTLPPGPPAS